MSGFDFTVEGDGSQLFFGGLIVTVALVFSFLFLLYLSGIYLLNAIPLYKIGKKLGYNKNFLPWIPVTVLSHIYVLGDLPGIESFSVSPKVDRYLKINTRKKSYIVYVIMYAVSMAVSFVFSGFSELVSVFFSNMTTEYSNDGMMIALSALSFFVSLFSSVIPALLSLVLSVYCAMSTYAYLRDLINIFKPDRASNARAALVVAILYPFTSGLSLPVYLCYLSRLEPLPEDPYESYETYEDNEAAFCIEEDDIGEPPYYPEVSGNSAEEDESLT